MAYYYARENCAQILAFLKILQPVESSGRYTIGNPINSDLDKDGNKTVPSKQAGKNCFSECSQKDIKKEGI